METVKRMWGADRIFRFLDASDFLKQVNTNRPAIKRTRFIPPKIGDNHFGKFRVAYFL